MRELTNVEKRLAENRELPSDCDRLQRELDEAKSYRANFEHATKIERAEMEAQIATLTEERDAAQRKLDESKRLIKGIAQALLNKPKGDIYTFVPGTLAPEIAALRQRAEKAEAALKEVGEQLEFDRSSVADGLTSANCAIDRRHWLTEGRGSYEWDDDKWHDEFRQAAIEIKDSLAPLTKIAANWKDCPQTGEAVAQSRIDLKQQIATLTEELGHANSNFDNAREQATDLQRENATLREALVALKEDYADSEGCYCGQIIGGTDTEGQPLGKCGYCKARAAVTPPAQDAKEKA